MVLNDRRKNILDSIANVLHSYCIKKATEIRTSGVNGNSFRHDTIVCAEFVSFPSISFQGCLLSEDVREREEQSTNRHSMTAFFRTRPTGSTFPNRSSRRAYR